MLHCINNLQLFQTLLSHVCKRLTQVSINDSEREQTTVINPRLKLVQSTTIERKLTFKSIHKVSSPTMMILIIKLSDIDILILKTIMNWKHNIDWNVWIIFFNEAKFEFVKHSKKSFSIFGGYLISTNIHLRKEEGYYDYPCREGEKLCLVVDVRSLTLLLRSMPLD